MADDQIPEEGIPQPTPPIPDASGLEQVLGALLDRISHPPPTQGRLKFAVFDPATVAPKTWLRTSSIIVKNRVTNQSDLVLALTDAMKGAASEWFSDVVDDTLTWTLFQQQFEAKLLDHRAHGKGLIKGNNLDNNHSSKSGVQTPHFNHANQPLAPRAYSKPNNSNILNSYNHRSLSSSRAESGSAKHAIQLLTTGRTVSRTRTGLNSSLSSRAKDNKRDGEVSVSGATDVFAWARQRRGTSPKILAKLGFVSLRPHLTICLMNGD
ncbi:hypothetical protein GE061_015770 [Apolygus lucorum]|uniref:Uncharacterized protein n=1 Tax=Apolygus lucorum TaxID=248454 RepID=A0A8S9XR07_APOLU|nr:hypothetical protein GE061_015770 [Apolygus lucorum]